MINLKLQTTGNSIGDAIVMSMSYHLSWVV